MKDLSMQFLNLTFISFNSKVINENRWTKNYDQGSSISAFNNEKDEYQSISNHGRFGRGSATKYTRLDIEKNDQNDYSSLKEQTLSQEMK